MMTTPTLITPNPITDGQKDSIVRIAEEAVKTGFTTLNLTNPGGQRLFTRGDEFKARIIAAMNELSVPLPDLDYFGIADWRTLHRVVVTGKQTVAIGEFPWSEAVLNAPCPFHPGKMIRETHFAFVGLDHVTIAELQKLYPQSGQPRFYSYEDSWYAKQKFATKTTLALRWYLLLKDIVPGSENKTFDEQQAMLPKEYEVPSAVAEIAKDLFVFQKTGKHVNPNRYARTADFDSDGNRVGAGLCDASGVVVSDDWDARRGGGLGVGASRKFA
jgi:hypothetical protein